MGGHPSTSAAPLRLAAVSIGAAQVGVAVDAVLHAMPLAGALALLPRRAGALCGVVEHGGKLLPVVDLARWVEVGVAPDKEPSAARILLLRDGTRSIGLRVDAVRGLAEVAERDLVRLHHDQAPDEVFHSMVRTREPESILSVLDVGRLVTLAMAWHQDEAPQDVGASDAATGTAKDCVSASAAGATQVYGLLRLAGALFAVPVMQLAEVLPMPAVQRPGFGIAHCLWRGRHVPVLPASVLASDAPTGNPALLAVIEHDGLALGVPVDAALGMQPFTLTPDAPDQDGKGALCYDAEGNAVLLLDPARLLGRFPEAALSRRQQPAGTPGASATQASNPTAHIVFEADGLASTPIDAIEQVLALDAAATDAGLGATMPWRGKAIVVRDLRPGGHAGPAQALIVRHGEGAGLRHVACVVSHVRQLIAPRGGRLYRIGAVEFISVGDAGAQSSYRLHDLGRLAAAS